MNVNLPDLYIAAAAAASVLIFAFGWDWWRSRQEKRVPARVRRAVQRQSHG